MGNNNSEFSSAVYNLAQGQRSWGLGALCDAFTRVHKRLAPLWTWEDDVMPHFRTHPLSYKSSSKTQNTDIFDFEHVRPKAVIAYISGWKGHPITPLEIEYIKALRGAGFATVAIPIEDPGDEVATLEGSANRVTAFLTSPESPLNTKYKDLPRIVISHSTGGLVLQQALDRMDDRHFRKDMLVVNTASFLAPANASDHHPFKKWAYRNLHAIWHTNAHTGDTLFDRIYYYTSGIGKRLGMQGTPPTHGQVLQLAQEGSDLIDYTKRRKDQKSLLPVNRAKQIFVISEDDNFACSATAIEYANLIGAEIMSVRAEHNPLMNADVRQRIIDRIDQELGAFYPKFAVIPPYARNTVEEAVTELHSLKSGQPPTFDGNALEAI